MAVGQGGGHLAVLAAMKQRVLKTKKVLGLSERGIQKPLTGPPPKAPAAAAPAGAPATDPRAQPLAKVRDFLAQQQGAQSAPPQGGDVVSTPPPPAVTLDGPLRAASAQNEPIETQYMRLAGRPGSPQELAVFGTRLQLEKELGRPPTAPELRGRLLGSAIQSSALPVAFDLPAEQTQ